VTRAGGPALGHDGGGDPLGVQLMIAVLGHLAHVERPHPHRRGPQPGAEARAAHGPPVEIDAGAAGRGPPATGTGRDARRTRAQLPRRQEHDFPALDFVSARVEQRRTGRSIQQRTADRQSKLTPAPAAVSLL
jgi:hypothetical protein